MQRPLRSVFRDLVLLASAAPLVGCASMVIPEYDGAPVSDAVVHDGPTCRAHASGTGGSCGDVEIWPCGAPVIVPPFTFQSGAVCDTLCPDFIGQSFYSHSCEINTTSDAGSEVRVSCVFCRGGRRPEGWTLEASETTGTPLGRFFAALAELEAVSIPAFRALADDLRAHAAPAALVDAANAAIADERRHTRVMRSLARRFGATPRSPRVARRGVSSIEAMARLNAVEGCVGETYGALLATYQSTHAADAEVRRVMARVAEDETRHADLAFEVAAWADGRLDVAARERVANARREALEALRDGVVIGVHADLIAQAGMPGAQQSRVLFDGLAREIAA